jgi:hypothetical protein
VGYLPLDPKRFDPKYGLNFIRDPIYQYIPFTTSVSAVEETEQSLIDSQWVQRLRRIYQNQGCFGVYPGVNVKAKMHNYRAG